MTKFFPITILLITFCLFITTICATDPIPIPLPFDITPVSINSTQSFFLISTTLTIKCPEAPTPGPTPPFIVQKNDLFQQDDPTPTPTPTCILSQVSFAPPPPTPIPPPPDDDNIIPTNNNSIGTTADPIEPVSSMVLTIADVVIINNNNTPPPSSLPIHIQIKENSFITTPLLKVSNDDVIYITLLITFDSTKTILVKDSNIVFNTNVVLTSKYDDIDVDQIHQLDITVPFITSFGNLKTIAQYRHYYINGIIDPTLPNEDDESDHQDDDLRPLALENASISIHDIVPSMGLYNITLTELENENITKFEKISISTQGFFIFDLFNNNGDQQRDQTITCTINNIEFQPQFLFNYGHGKTTVIEIPILPQITEAIKNIKSLTLSLSCPDQLLLVPNYPNTDTTTNYLVDLPYSMTISLIGTVSSRSNNNDDSTTNFVNSGTIISSATSLIIPTNVVAMPQDSNQSRPISTLSVVDGYYDNDVIYCKVNIIHDWYKAYGYQDLIGIFTDTTTPAGNSVMIERRPNLTPDHSRKATPSTVGVNFSQISSQSGDSKIPLPLAVETYSSGNVPLNADSVNKHSKDGIVSVLVTIPLIKEDSLHNGVRSGDSGYGGNNEGVNRDGDDQVYSNDVLVNPNGLQTMNVNNNNNNNHNNNLINTLTQCNFLYTQQYGIKIKSSKNQLFKQNDLIKYVEKSEEQHEIEKISQNDNSSEQNSLSFPSSPSSSPTKLTKLTDVQTIPTPINSYSILSSRILTYIPPVAQLVQFNVSDIHGPIQFNMFLKTFKIDVSEIKSGLIVLDFPTQSYTFYGDLLCYFNDLPIRGVGIDSSTDGGHAFNIQDQSGNDQFEPNSNKNQFFPTKIDNNRYFNVKYWFEDLFSAFSGNADIAISCPNISLEPSWRNYYYVRATIPVRVMVYHDDARTKLLASSSTLSVFPATKSYIVIAIVLSVIGFFFLFTIALTKICNGLIDRLHKHKIHVIPMQSGGENGQQQNGQQNGHNNFQNNNHNHNNNNNTKNNNIPGPASNINSHFNTSTIFTSSSTNTMMGMGRSGGNGGSNQPYQQLNDEDENNQRNNNNNNNNNNNSKNNKNGEKNNKTANNNNNHNNGTNNIGNNTPGQSKASVAYEFDIPLR